MADAGDLFLLLTLLLLAAGWFFRCFFFCSGGTAGLPPGPPGWPLVGNLFQIVLRRRHFVFVAGELRKTYGDMFTLRMGQRTLVVVTSPELIHEALVKRGADFASRPADSPTRLLFSVGKCAVNSATYGPLWRSLRRNFVAEVVSAQKVKSYAWIREWAAAGHIERLRGEFAVAGAVQLMASCRFTICSILLCICFGAKLPEKRIRAIEEVLKEVMLISLPKLPDFLPALTVLFRTQLGSARRLRRRQLELLLPLVRARKQFLDHGDGTVADDDVCIVSKAGDAYVDSLFALEAAERGRLGEPELVTLCSEVLSAGTDTSATALEWAMMHLVLDDGAQERLHGEVVAIAGVDGRITEAHIDKMPYLQAVVKETLRRHPPAHFLLSHAATHETELGGYRIPADASVEFYTAWMTQDPAIWTDPGEWRPERFLEGGEGFGVNITGTRAACMAPFGAGRRICPAASLGMLHVQLLLATMVREFRWVPVPGEAPPDAAEMFAFTMVMKNPLRAAIIERRAGPSTVDPM